MSQVYLRKTERYLIVCDFPRCILGELEWRRGQPTRFILDKNLEALSIDAVEVILTEMKKFEQEKENVNEGM